MPFFPDHKKDELYGMAGCLERKSFGQTPYYFSLQGRDISLIWGHRNTEYFYALLYICFCCSFSLFLQVFIFILCDFLVNYE